ncbi:MAG: DUF2442 domain-containing protein [Spirosomataceae bacterium]|jgi:hypothetical protein
MILKVIQAKYIKEFEVELTFNDGSKGIADLKNAFQGPIFEKLKNVNYFKRFTLNRWTIEWENGADFAPEFLQNLALKGEAQAEN